MRYKAFPLLLLFLALPAGATDRYVDADCLVTDTDYDPATRTTGSGSSLCYASLQLALTAAAAGDTVYLRTGTYALTARTDVTGKTGTDATHKITVRNYASEAVVIDGTSGPASSSSCLLRIINSDYVVLQGITITNAQTVSLRVDSSDYVEITNVTISNGKYRALFIYNHGDHITLDGVTVKNITVLTGQTTVKGIYAYWADYLTVQNCVVDGVSGGSSSNNGIALEGCSNCLIDRNEAAHAQPGIQITGQLASLPANDVSSSDNTISNNLVHDNSYPKEGADGITIGIRAYDSTVTNNVCYGNIDDGIDSGTSQSGTSVRSNERNLIVHNICFSNGQGGAEDGAGIKVGTNAGGDHQIAYNVCFNNLRCGFDQAPAEGSKKNYFYQNTAYGNGDIDWIPHSNVFSGFVIDAQNHPVKERAVLHNNISRANVEWAVDDVAMPTGSSVGSSDYDWLDGGYGAQAVYTNTLTGDPGFLSPTATVDTVFGADWTIDEKLAYLRGQVEYMFGLATASNAIDAGGFLSTITSVTGSGTSFTVADPNYFYVGAVIETAAHQTATVTQRNRTTNTITVGSSISWTQNEGIAISYNGTAPDVGAYESSAVAPDAPVLTSPADGATNQDTVVNLTWTGSAQYFQVCINTSSDYFDWDAPTFNHVTGYTQASGTLLAGTLYYWQVRAVNVTGSALSAIRSFTTETPIAAPDKVTGLIPVNAATGVVLAPLLSWSLANGATKYDVYLKTLAHYTTDKNAFDAGDLISDDETDLSFQVVTALTSNTAYRWRVDSINTAATVTGDVSGFTTYTPAVRTYLLGRKK